MEFKAIFNNISVILILKIGVSGETTTLHQVTDKLYHKMLYTSPWTIFKRRILTYLTKHNSHFYFNICLKISWKENLNIDGQQFHRYQKNQTTASHLYSPDTKTDIWRWKSRPDIDVAWLNFNLSLLITTGCCGVRVARSFVFCLMFCRLLFVFLSFFWPLYCLSFSPAAIDM
jgi:hypothetical protein